MTVTNQTLSAPPHVREAIPVLKMRALNLRGRAQGLVGHSHNRSAYPLPDLFSVRFSFPLAI